MSVHIQHNSWGIREGMSFNEVNHILQLNRITRHNPPSLPKDFRKAIRYYRKAGYTYPVWHNRKTGHFVLATFHNDQLIEFGWWISKNTSKCDKCERCEHIIRPSLSIVCPLCGHFDKDSLISVVIFTIVILSVAFIVPQYIEIESYLVYLLVRWGLSIFAFLFLLNSIIETTRDIKKYRKHNKKSADGIKSNKNKVKSQVQTANNLNITKKRNTSPHPNKRIREIINIVSNRISAMPDERALMEEICAIGTDAVEPLVNALRSPPKRGHYYFSHHSQMFFMLALGNIGDKRATTAIIEILDLPDDNTAEILQLWLMVPEVLGMIGDDKAIKCLKELVENAPKRLSDAAKKALKEHSVIKKSIDTKKPSKIDQYERALAHYKQEDSAVCHYGAGLCLYKLGRLKEARLEIDHCLKIDPNFSRAKKLIKLLSATKKIKPTTVEQKEVTERVLSEVNESPKFQNSHKETREQPVIEKTKHQIAIPTFENLFADLTNKDLNIRAEAVSQLINNNDAIPKLVSIYRSYWQSDPRRATLAGRILGRKLQSGNMPTDFIHAKTSQIVFGLFISFIPCVCAYCGHMNAVIPAPPAAPQTPYYAQKNSEGAYAVPVFCDKCGREFFVVWDIDISQNKV